MKIAGEAWSGEMTCNACPVQIEGIVDGLPFYFRARFKTISFSVADRASGDPVAVNLGHETGFHVQRKYSDEPYAAGWICQEEALRFLAEFIALFRAPRLAVKPEPG